jgi:hypothetical protein
MSKNLFLLQSGGGRGGGGERESLNGSYLWFHLFLFVQVLEHNFRSGRPFCIRSLPLKSLSPVYISDVALQKRSTCLGSLGVATMEENQL